MFINILILKAIDSTKNHKGFLLSPVYKHLNVYLQIQGMERAPDWRKPARCKQHILITNLSKEWMKKFVALLTLEKEKIAMNE